MFTSTTTDGAMALSGHFALSASVASIPETIYEDNTPYINCVALAAGSVPPNWSCLFADSGCTTHFFKSHKVFVNHKPVAKLIGQSSKEGTSFMILGIGNVVIRVINGGKEHTLTFRDALHAPDIMANLISISKLDLAGWHSVFGNRKVQFFHNKTKVFMGELKNGMYLISGSFTVPVLAVLTA